MTFYYSRYRLKNEKLWFHSETWGEFVPLDCEGDVLDIADDRARETWDAGLPPKFATADFDDLDPDPQPQALAAAKHFSERLIAGEQGQGLLLSGPRGIGKTTLSAAIVNEYLSEVKAFKVEKDGSILFRKCPAYFVSEVKLFARLRDSFKEEADETEADIIKDILGHDLIVLDDVGQYAVGKLDFVHRIWFALIDGIYGQESAFIINSNADIAQLSKHLGGAVEDRISEQADMVVMVGESYRRKARAKRQSKGQ